LFNSWLLLCIYHYLLPLISIPLASNLHLFNLLNHSHYILLHDPLRLPTTGTTPDHHRHLTLTVPIEYLKLVLPHHLRCGPSSTHGAPAKRLGLLLLVGVEIGDELLFKLLHLVLVDLSDLGLEESHHWPVAAQLQVAGTVIENLLKILTERLFCFIENAVGPTGDSCGVVLIRIELVFVSRIKVQRGFLEISHNFTIFLSESSKLFISMQLFIVFGGNQLFDSK
jgi:hypothetical protein